MTEKISLERQKKSVRHGRKSKSGMKEKVSLGRQTDVPGA
jgi:hypothetical protein